MVLVAGLARGLVLELRSLFSLGSKALTAFLHPRQDTVPQVNNVQIRLPTYGSTKQPAFQQIWRVVDLIAVFFVCCQAVQRVCGYEVQERVANITRLQPVKVVVINHHLEFRLKVIDKLFECGFGFIWIEVPFFITWTTTIFMYADTITNLGVFVLVSESHCRRTFYWRGHVFGDRSG
jgi:hypothetical protein